MSTLLSYKDVITENLLACRTCLANNRKLYSLTEANLKEAYEFLIGKQVLPSDGLPKYLCNFCTILLLKFNTFRRNCQQIQEKLLTNPLAGAHPISLEKSRTIIFEVNVALKKEQNSIENSVEGYSQYMTYSHQIPEKLRTDTFEIKTEIIETEELEQIFIETNFEDRTDSSETPAHFTLNTLKTENQIYQSKANIKDTSIKTSKWNSDSSEMDLSSGKTNSFERTGKYFETDANMRDFELAYDVDVIILSHEQQIKDVLDRKLSDNYLHSPFKCELCYKGFMDEDNLAKHISDQHDPNRASVVCEFCSFRYKDKKGLNQHLKSHRLKFVCKQCNYVSRTTFNAKGHFRTHTGQTHRCSYCGKCYDKLTSYLTHLKLQHPSNLIWCELCGDAFVGQFGLNAHKKRAHRHLQLFYCNKCDAGFISAKALKQHLSYNDCSGACVQCGSRLQEGVELRDHLLTVHRSSKVYECNECNKTFGSQSLRSAHYRRSHFDKKDKNNTQRVWVCEICGKSLPNKAVLRYHQRNHTGERPFKCAECPKSFTMSKLLQSHLRVHTSDRPFKCKVCSKTFKRLPALRAHEQRHTDVQKKEHLKTKKKSRL